MQALAANPNPGSKSHEDDRLSKRSLALRYPSPLPTALERPAGFASVVRGLHDMRDGEAVRACFSLFHFFHYPLPSYRGRRRVLFRVSLAFFSSERGLG